MDAYCEDLKELYQAFVAVSDYEVLPDDLPF